MKLQTLISLSILFLILACTNQSHNTSIKKSPLKPTSLNNSSLESLLQFVERKIACDPKIKAKEICWENWLNSFAFDSISGSILIPWTVEEQDSFMTIPEHKGIRDFIWTQNLAFNSNKQDTFIYQHIDFQGSFGKNYSVAAKENKKWAGIWDHIKSSGEISISLQSFLINPERNTLLPDPKMRLLMSIYLFTLNENHYNQSKLLELSDQ